MFLLFVKSGYKASVRVHFNNSVTSAVTHRITMSNFKVIAAPTVWNSLSLSTRSANTFGTFKSRLKTELFMSAYTT